MRIKHKYGCHNAMADGGKVEKPKMKPHVPPRIVDPIPKGDPGGPHTPGAKAKRKKKGKKMADGGPVKAHGAPMGPTPKPGGTTRKRPKVGDKDPNYKPSKPSKKRPAPAKPKPTKKKPDYPHRDYRGTKGAIEDAGG